MGEAKLRKDTVIEAFVFSVSLERMQKNWLEALNLGLKLGVPEALGLTPEAWANSQISAINARLESIAT